MAKRLTIPEYYELPETMRPMELVYGEVREPPPPSYGHQAVVTRLTVLLTTHVVAEHLGIVCVSPVDVVLDADKALVIQPDIVFVASDRRHIIRDRIWGAPDLVVEVLSPGTARRDRTTKLGWYREYGVKECWLIDTRARELEIVYLDGAAESHTRFVTGDRISSRVLPNFNVEIARIFEQGLVIDAASRTGLP